MGLSRPSEHHGQIEDFMEIFQRYPHDMSRFHSSREYLKRRQNNQMRWLHHVEIQPLFLSSPAEFRPSSLLPKWRRYKLREPVK